MGPEDLLVGYEVEGLHLELDTHLAGHVQLLPIPDLSVGPVQPFNLCLQAQPSIHAKLQGHDGVVKADASEELEVGVQAQPGQVVLALVLGVP